MTPEDAIPVADGTALYRRINPDAHLVPDENEHCMRISTGAFRDPDMSVALGDTLQSLGRDPASVLANYPGQSLVSFRAVVAREHDLPIEREPTEDEEAHGVVRGKKRQAVMKALASACEWVVRPPNACEPPYPTREPQAPGEAT